jgi:hypothetical protein
MVYSYSSDDPKLCVSRNIHEKDKSLTFVHGENGSCHHWTFDQHRTNGP